MRRGAGCSDTRKKKCSAGTFSEFIHPDFREVFKENFPKFKSMGYILGVEFEMIKKDGSEIVVAFDGKIGHKEDGSFKQTHCVLSDITERKRTREALQESEEKYRAIFESASDAIFTVRMSDEGPRFLDFNPTALKMYGCKPEELLGASPADFAPSVQPDGRSTEERIAELSAATMAGKTEFFEWRHLRKDGTTFDAEATLSPVSIGGERYLQAIVRDITERKREQEERLSLERQMQHAQKLESLGVLAGGIAHDFNNLLMAILGNAELGAGRALAHVAGARQHPGDREGVQARGGTGQTDARLLGQRPLRRRGRSTPGNSSRRWRTCSRCRYRRRPCSSTTSPRTCPPSTATPRKSGRLS